MIQTNTYPVGAVAVCRFAFTLRQLTTLELARFLAGAGLPSGVGSSPNTVLFNYWAGGEVKTQLTTSTTPPIVQDATGAYHVNLPITVPGPWYYQGIGQDGSGNPVGATRRYLFQATAS